VREQEAGYGAALPGPIYCHTSALLKLYFREPGSDEFNRLVEGRADLVLSDLGVTELVSALARRVDQRTVARDVARRAQQTIIRSLDDGTYHRVELTREVHRRAEDFLLRFAPPPLRAADALHLALATYARAAAIASFDRRLGTAARAVGFATYPP